MAKFGMIRRGSYGETMRRGPKGYARRGSDDTGEKEAYTATPLTCLTITHLSLKMVVC